MNAGVSRVISIAALNVLVFVPHAAFAQSEATPHAVAPETNGAAPSAAEVQPEPQVAETARDTPTDAGVASEPEFPNQADEIAGSHPVEAELPPIVSSLDFEAAAYLSLTFGEQAIPGVGSVNPVGGSAFAAIRYVPRTFPFHAFFQTGGGLVATGTTTGPSGTDYSNVLSALFFTPGVGLDMSVLRLEVGIGPALVFASTSSKDEGSSSASLAVSGEVGLSYRFLEKTTWAMSAGLRYQAVPGAGLESLYLGVQVRFGSIVYR